MNINFNEMDRTSTNSFINVADGTTTYSASHNIGNIDGSGFRLDISSIVTDNNAYKGHGKTAEEVAMMADSTDVSAYRDYMAVMSNCLSSEDFDKLQKEGIDPGKTDFEETVTIIDHIKAALVKGGTEVKGYTDTISDDALLNILGSQAYADELISNARAKDIPLNAENVKEIASTYDKLSSIGSLNDGSRKYLVENNLSANIDNLYTASHAGVSDPLKQARGYYNAGDVSGYYAKKPEAVDIEALKPQIERIIENANLEVSDENIADATWLVEKGIPLTEDTLLRFENIKSLNLPMAFSEFVSKATDAISDGIAINKVDLTRTESLRKRANDIFDEVQNNGTIKGRRVLEEVRLSMSVEANLRLLRKGINIDTAPMEELIKNLKEAEEEIAKTLTHEEDGTKAIEKRNIVNNTLDIIANIKTAPINIVYAVNMSDTLTEINVKANEAKASFTKANESYEALMTAPRSDLGDSIKKAFANVDDILNEMDQALTEENRRAVRILGYNGAEITNDNLLTIKEKDRVLQNTISEMTPGRVLGMIRSGINPTTMPVNELDQYLRGLDTTKEDMLSFSKYLYKLEKDHEITKEEKDAYIGIYRLVRQIEKADFSAVGAINEIGAAFSLENMLSAIRSKKHGRMDYRIDDSFSGVDVKETAVESITSQISKGFLTDTSEMNNMLNDSGNQAAEQEFDNNLAEEIRKTYKSEKEVIEALINYDEEISAENLQDMEVLLKEPSVVFRRLRDIGYRKVFTPNLDNKNKAKESYKEFTGSIKDFLENEVFGLEESAIPISSNNVRQIGKIYQHFDFLERRSEEEEYEIPTEIDGELTAINLKVIHNKKDNVKVSISFETRFYGKVAAEFKVTEKGLNGYCSLTNKDGAKILENNKSALDKKLKESDINISNIYFAGTDRLNLQEFNLRQIKDRENDTDVITTDGLYKAAKAFIEYVVESADAV